MPSSKKRNKLNLHQETKNVIVKFVDEIMETLSVYQKQLKEQNDAERPLLEI